jgi:hypothetical protein
MNLDEIDARLDELGQQISVLSKEADDLRNLRTQILEQDKIDYIVNLGAFFDPSKKVQIIPEYARKYESFSDLTIESFYPETKIYLVKSSECGDEFDRCIPCFFYVPETELMYAEDCD